MCLHPKPLRIQLYRKRIHARVGALNLDHLNLGWPQYLSQISFDILPKKNQFWHEIYEHHMMTRYGKLFKQKKKYGKLFVYQYYVLSNKI